MKYYALSGRPSKRKAFVVTVIITIITSFLFYHMIKLHNAHNTAIDFYQRRVASLEKRILVLEKKTAQYQHDLNEQITVIGDVMQGSLSMEARKQINGVRRVLQSLAAPRFKHRPETSHLDCRRLFHEDKQYMTEVTRARITLIESSVLDMDCAAVRWRVLPRLQPPTIGYGIAFARIVYTDYEFLEEQLQVNYSPENHYCYHVDSKSPAVFKERMANLSSCLPNVYLTDEVLEIDGRVGTNMNFAHMACLKLLEKKGTWEYVVLQQNHDVVIRTNEELKHIFQALNGSNDVQINPCSSYFCDKSLTWDAESLDVFQGSGFRPSSEALRTPLFLVKGAVQVSLTRKAVEWLNRINLTKLISQFNSGKNAVDEILMSTLQIADEWMMPGRFTRQCFINDTSYDGITRMVQWRDTSDQCKAGYLRHSVCVLGTEDLPSISGYHHVLVNKMMPSFDYGAIACVSELLFNRTYLAQNDHPLNISYFENLPVILVDNDFAKKNKDLCKAHVHSSDH